jgi:hypothetical protein
MQFNEVSDRETRAKSRMLSCESWPLGGNPALLLRSGRWMQRNLLNNSELRQNDSKAVCRFMLSTTAVSPVVDFA